MKSIQSTCIAAVSGSVINFSWQSGEPITLGLDYFSKIVAPQCQHQPPKFYEQ